MITTTAMQDINIIELKASFTLHLKALNRYIFHINHVQNLSYIKLR